jgi:hypothetical protein
MYFLREKKTKYLQICYKPREIFFFLCNNIFSFLIYIAKRSITKYSNRIYEVDFAFYSQLKKKLIKNFQVLNRFNNNDTRYSKKIFVKH